MNATYDPEVDVLRIVLNGAAIEESDEDKPSVILSLPCVDNPPDHQVGSSEH